MVAGIEVVTDADGGPVARLDELLALAHPDAIKPTASPATTILRRTYSIVVGPKGRSKSPRSQRLSYGGSPGERATDLAGT